LNLLLDIIKYTMFRPEELSRRILRFIVALGFAISVKSLLFQLTTNIIVLATLALLLILAFSRLHFHFRRRIEEEFNKAVRQIAMDLMEPSKFLEIMKEVEFEGKSYLDYIFTGRPGELKEFTRRFNWRLATLILIAQFTLFLTIVWVVLLLLIIWEAIYNPLPRLGAIEGCTLVVTSYLLALVLVLHAEPIEYRTERKEQARQFTPVLPDIAGLVESFTRKFLYENIVKKPYSYFYILLLPFLDLILPNVRLRVERPTAKFGVLVCSGMLYDAIRKLEKENLIKVEDIQPIDQFFQCDKTERLQAWGTLENVRSLKEALDKIMGVNSQHSQAFLKLNVMRDGEVVGYIVMRAWKGCKIKHVVRERKDCKIKSERKLVKVLEPMVVGNVRLISIFAVGIREPIELIWTELMLNSKLSTIQEQLCVEEEATTQAQTGQQQ